MRGFGRTTKPVFAAAPRRPALAAGGFDPMQHEVRGHPDHHAPEGRAEPQEAHPGGGGEEGDDRGFPVVFLGDGAHQVRGDRADQREARQHRHELLRQQGE